MTRIPDSHRRRLRYPDRYRARNAVRVARRNGTLVPGPCETAGEDCRGRIEAHHDDYSKSLEVRWFCRHHHLQVDWDKRGRAKKAAVAARQPSARCKCGVEWSHAKSGLAYCRPCSAKNMRAYRERKRQAASDTGAVQAASPALLSRTENGWRR